MLRAIKSACVVGQKFSVNVCQVSKQSSLPRGIITHTCIRRTQFTQTTGKTCSFGILRESSTTRSNIILRISNFHTSPRRDVPPWIALYVVKPAVKLAAVLFGRASRKHWKELSLQTQLLIPFGGFALLCAVLGGYYYSHLQETPITKRERFVCVTVPQLEKICQFEAEMLKESYAGRILPSTHPYYRVLLSVGIRLLKGNQDLPQLKDIKWKIAVVEDDAPNAMVLPTGDVFVNTGLMEFVDNEDQLAFVFGHEMSHALLLHAAENLSLATLVDFGMIVVLAMIWCIIPSDGIASITHWYFNKVSKIMIELPFSRQMEEEADHVGHMLMAKACYDVREGSVFWRKMWSNKNVSKLSVAKDSAILSTHPSHEQRVKLLDKWMPEAIKERDASKCPPLPPVDPRKRVIEAQKIINDRIIAVKAGEDLRQVKRVIPGGRQRRNVE